MGLFLWTASLWWGYIWTPLIWIISVIIQWNGIGYNLVEKQNILLGFLYFMNIFFPFFSDFFLSSVRSGLSVLSNGWTDGWGDGWTRPRLFNAEVRGDRGDRCGRDSWGTIIFQEEVDTVKSPELLEAAEAEEPEEEETGTEQKHYKVSSSICLTNSIKV